MYKLELFFPPLFFYICGTLSFIFQLIFFYYLVSYPLAKESFFEQNVGLLLAILESQQEASSVHLLSLMKLGLPSLLVNLLASEMSTLRGERVPERYDIVGLKGVDI